MLQRNNGKGRREIGALSLSASAQMPFACHTPRGCALAIRLRALRSAHAAMGHALGGFTGCKIRACDGQRMARHTAGTPRPSSRGALCMALRLRARRAAQSLRVPHEPLPDGTRAILPWCRSRCTPLLQRPGGVIAPLRRVGNKLCLGGGFLQLRPINGNEAAEEALGSIADGLLRLLFG